MVRPIPSRLQWEELAVQAGYQATVLATICQRSSRHLRRQFQSSLGCSPQIWLDEQRLVRAQQMLLSGASVKEVALTLGFRHPSHFCRHFKARAGMTPSQFVLRRSATTKCPPELTNVRHG
jgi:AraC-like DNA-binding protein